MSQAKGEAMVRTPIGAGEDDGNPVLLNLSDAPKLVRASSNNMESFLILRWLLFGF
jgi:hypothetical protein